MHKFILLAVIVFSVFSSGCTTTHVVGTETIRGELLDSETRPQQLDKEHLNFDLDSRKVTLTKTNYYSQKKIKRYQRIKSTRYEDVFTRPAATLPLAVLCPPMSLISIIVGTSSQEIDVAECISLFSVHESTEFREEDRVLSGNPIVRERTERYQENVPLTGSRISLLLEGQPVKQLEVDDQGQADYDLLSLIKEKGIHPRELVHDKSLRLSARYGTLRRHYEISSKSIPEKFFKAQYEQRQQSLLAENEARHDNCRTIAVNFREFFECFYQRSLM